MSSRSDDGTHLTQDEYLELMQHDLLETPIHKLILERVKDAKSHKMVMGFLAFLREEEPEFVHDYNNSYLMIQSYMDTMRD